MFEGAGAVLRVDGRRFGGAGTRFGGVAERFGVPSVSVCAVVGLAWGACREARRVPAGGAGGVPGDRRCPGRHEWGVRGLGAGTPGVSEDFGGEASRVRRGVGGVPSTRQGPGRREGEV